jgi:hypothetical protein
VNRAGALLIAALVLATSGVWIAAARAASELPSIQLNVAAVGPRPIEDSTEKAVVRDYAQAWQTMATALSENRADLLNADFAGVALDNLRQRVQQQQQSGLHTHYIDHGHKLDVIFYSLDGSAIQLRDTAQYEVQFLDGDKVISQQERTENYTVVMTAAENRWKVRVLQATLGQAE